jgi:hypothetical protein
LNRFRQSDILRHIFERVVVAPHRSLNGCATVHSTNGRSSQNVYRNRQPRMPRPY